MARYLGAREKIERRLGEKLFLKGERSHSPKSAMTKRPYPPGVHGKAFSRKPSEFGQQLKSKQKVRNIYRMLEKQFKRTVKDALSTKKRPQESILQALESRLDNVVFRAGIAQSRDQARQLVNHGHITVNGKRVSTPSYFTRIGEVISVREASKKLPYFVAVSTQTIKNAQPPVWLDLNKDTMTAKIKSSASIEESGVKLEDLQAIIEYYSR